MRAMIVDDSRAMRSMLRKILQENGFEVVAEAENGRQGLDHLNRLGFVELTLLDWNMPVMNGFELLQWLRQFVTAER